MLLEHTVGNLDPLYIVNMVPNGLEIPRLVENDVKFLFQVESYCNLSALFLFFLFFY